MKQQLTNIRRPNATAAAELFEQLAGRKFREAEMRIVERILSGAADELSDAD